MSTRVEISKKLVLINITSSVAAAVLNAFVLIWMYQYLLHRISPEEFSLYPVLMGIMTFAPLLTVVLTGGLGRYIVEAYAKGDDNRVTQIVSTMFPLLLGIGIIMLAAGLILAWNINDVCNIEAKRLTDARIMMGLLVFSAALRLPLSPFGVGLYVRQRFVLQNLIGVSAEFLRIALLFVLLLGVSTRVLWLVVASVSAETVRLLITQYFSRRSVRSLKFSAHHIHWGIARELISFGGWNLVARLSSTISEGVIPFALNRLATAVDVNSFHIGTLPSRKIEEASWMLRDPLHPALTAMHATGSKDRLKNAYLRVGRYGLWAVLAIAVPLMIYAKEVVLLYVSQTYVSAAVVMALMMATFPIKYGNVMLGQLANATAQIGSFARRELFSQAMLVVLVAFFVWYLQMGAIGCALAIIIETAITWPLLFWPLGLRMAGVRPPEWLSETIWPGLLPGLVAAVAWIGLKFSVHPFSWLGVGACTAGGMLCYAVVLFFCLQEYDREQLRHVLDRVRALLQSSAEQKALFSTSRATPASISDAVASLGQRASGNPEKSCELTQQET
jgi:O-antigen/teichoic acid export membrane protein